MAEGRGGWTDHWQEMWQAGADVVVGQVLAIGRHSEDMEQPGAEDTCVHLALRGLNDGVDAEETRTAGTRSHNQDLQTAVVHNQGKDKGSNTACSRVEEPEDNMMDRTHSQRDHIM